MERRCIILENCPTLQYNAGVGVGDNGECCDIHYLRSLLFDLMQEEVSSFCNPKEVAEKHQQVYRFFSCECCMIIKIHNFNISQLVYDDHGTFKFLSLRPDKIPLEVIQKLGKVGIPLKE